MSNNNGHEEKLTLEEARKILAAQGGIGSWSKTQVTLEGVSIPLKVNTPQGLVKCYVSLGPDAVASKEALLRSIESLVDMGLPVDAWNRSSEDGGGRGSYSDRGNYGDRGNGGGFSRGGGDWGNRGRRGW